MRKKPSAQNVSTETADRRSSINRAILMSGAFLNALGIKIAQKPYIVWSLGPKALIYESLDP